MTRLLFCAALAGGLYAHAAPEAPATNSTALVSGDTVVARGHGWQIHRRDVDQVLATLTAKDPLDKLPSDADIHALSRLLEIELVWQKATDTEKAAGWKYADDRYAYAAKALGAAEMERRFKAIGMTADDLRRSMAEAWTAEESLSRQLGISVTEAEMKEYYNDYPAASQVPEKARIRELLLLTTVGYCSDPLPAATIAEKHKLIFELYERVRAGEDFTALAKQYNENPGSIKTEAIPPPFPARQEEFGNLALSMTNNQISGILTNEDGYRFFQLLEKIPAKKYDFNTVSNRIKSYIIEGKTEELMPAYLDKLRAEAGVEILDPGLKAELDDAQAQQEAAEKSRAVALARLARTTNAAPAKPDGGAVTP